MDFVFGMVFGMIIAILTTVGIIDESSNRRVAEACQGSSWIIEEPLIKKTLTCVVELKEKK